MIRYYKADDLGFVEECKKDDPLCVAKDHEDHITDVNAGFFGVVVELKRSDGRVVRGVLRDATIEVLR